MPQVIYTEQTDEIVDLVERARTSADSHVALVVNGGTVGMQTQLNVRLLRQLGDRAGKTVSVISGDPYVQELSRRGGLATFASVPAFERGIQTVRPHSDEGMPTAVAATALAAAAVAPPALPPTAAAAAGTGASAGGGGSKGRRRPAVFVAAGLVLVGLVLLLVVAPSAKVTITLAGTPLSASPTIQGSPAAPTAGQADHIATAVVSSDQSAQFQAKPSGTQAVPAIAATGQVVFQTDLGNGVKFTVRKGDEFDTHDNPPVRFYATQDTPVTIPAGAALAYGSPSNAVPVADGTPEAKGNVAANTITQWPGNPCASNPVCPSGPKDITSTNPAPTTGGTDASTQTVASAGDVSGWNNQVTQMTQTLTAQVNTDMQNKLGGKVFAKDPGGNGTTVGCTTSPALPAANAPFTATQVTVDCQGKGAAYTPGDVMTAAHADLQSQVAQGDTINTASVNCTKPAVVQAADDGTVVLSVQCTGFSQPAIDTATLKTQITGKSPGDARNLIEHRLDHVQSVAVSQSPIPLFWLPFFSSRIEIDEAFVAQSGS
jgi:hypothetical protein